MRLYIFTSILHRNSPVKHENLSSSKHCFQGRPSIGNGPAGLLRQIAKEQKRSVVIVSHDQRTKDSADHVLWLEDGRFKEVAMMAIDPVCGMSVERE